jgi:hypothetical protein
MTIPVAYLDLEINIRSIVELPFNIQNTGSEVLNLNISVSGTGFSLPTKRSTHSGVFLPELWESAFLGSIPAVVPDS